MGWDPSCRADMRTLAKEARALEDDEFGMKKGHSHSLPVLKRHLERDSIKLGSESTESSRATGFFCNQGLSDWAAGEAQSHSSCRDGGVGDWWPAAPLDFPLPWGGGLRKMPDRHGPRTGWTRRDISSPNSLQPLIPILATARAQHHTNIPGLIPPRAASDPSSSAKHNTR